SIPITTVLFSFLRNTTSACPGSPTVTMGRFSPPRGSSVPREIWHVIDRDDEATNSVEYSNTFRVIQNDNRMIPTPPRRRKTVGIFRRPCVRSESPGTELAWDCSLDGQTS